MTAAQMAESVDALVSNTSGATRAGSTPALGTRKTAKTLYSMLGRFFHNISSPTPLLLAEEVCTISTI